MKSIREELESRFENLSDVPEITKSFEKYWDKIGSGVSPKIGEELHEFAKFVSLTSYLYGYQAASNNALKVFNEEIVNEN